MATKSNNTLKFIKRNIQTNIYKIKKTTFNTYVRPLLEYSETVWNPWQKKYTNQIEMVQHRALRYIQGGQSCDTHVVVSHVSFTFCVFCGVQK